LSLVIVQRNEELAAGRDHPSEVGEALPHRASVVQDSPGVDNVELPLTPHVVSIQDGAELDTPLTVTGKVPIAKFLSASHRFRIEVERLNSGPKFSGG